MTGDWIFLMCLWIFSVVLILAGFWPVSEERLARWSVRFDVRLSGETSSWVRSRLRWARSVRWASFAVGMNLSALPMYMNVLDASRAGNFSNQLTSSSVFLAPTIGALVAELVVVQRPTGEHSAVLIRRRSQDYIDRFWIGAIVACGALSAAAALAATSRQVPKWGFAWVGPAAALTALASTTFGVRRIVNRPVVAPDGPLRAADEALRADGAHHIAGASVALAVTATVAALLLATPNGWWQIPIALANYLGIAWWSRLAVGERWSVALARRAAA